MIKFVATAILGMCVITNPVNAGTWAKADTAIAKASYDTGYPVTELAGIASLESDFNPKAVSPNKAKGLLQQTPRTFKYLSNKYAKKHGFKHPNPFNPVHSATLGAEYLTEIKDTLSTQLNRPVKPEEVYMGYLLGPTGALKVIKAPGWKSSVKIMSPIVVNSHKRFFYTNRKPNSVKAFRNIVYNEYLEHVNTYRNVALVALANHKHLSGKLNTANPTDLPTDTCNRVIVTTANHLIYKCPKYDINELVAIRRRYS